MTKRLCEGARRHRATMARGISVTGVTMARGDSATGGRLRTEKRHDLAKPIRKKRV